MLHDLVDHGHRVVEGGVGTGAGRAGPLDREHAEAKLPAHPVVVHERAQPGAARWMYSTTVGQ